MSEHDPVSEDSGDNPTLRGLALAIEQDRQERAQEREMVLARLDSIEAHSERTVVVVDDLGRVVTDIRRVLGRIATDVLAQRAEAAEAATAQADAHAATTDALVTLTSMVATLAEALREHGVAVRLPKAPPHLRPVVGVPPKPGE